MRGRSGRRCAAEYVYDAGARAWRVRCDCGAEPRATYDSLDDATASWVAHRNASAVQVHP